MSTMTPMMKQYYRIKKEYPDSILFFRMGDFYEMFSEDAKIASKVLGIALTSRAKGKGEKIPLCGMPYHSLDKYLEKMVDSGFTVAICEQVEDPKKAKGIVKREIVRVVTASTLIRSGTDLKSENTYLASVFPKNDEYGFMIVDLATGEFRGTIFDGDNAKTNLKIEISRLEPKEILIPLSQESKDDVKEIYSLESVLLVTKRDDWWFSKEQAESILKEHFGVLSIDGVGFSDNDLLICAGGGIISYLAETQKTALDHINSFKYYSLSDHMVLDPSTLKNLEILKNNVDNTKDGTLLQIIDFTETAMGKRLIKNWLINPLLEQEDINKRLDIVESVRNAYALQSGIDSALENIYDIERIISKISLETANGRDLVALNNSLKMIPLIKDVILKTESGPLKDLIANLDEVREVTGIIDETIMDEPPISLREGGLIKNSYDDELDKLRKITTEGKTFISNLEETEKAKTGISNLKVRYNKVFGYYIEVTKSQAGKVPEDYIRKQTLVNAERFITPELKEYEEQVLNAQERLFEVEYELFCKIRKQIGRESRRIQQTAKVIAQIDVLSSYSKAAASNNWKKPRVDNSSRIKIIEGRHPVIERLSSGMKFVPNDLELDCNDKSMFIITGPNMAGKSTYIRQVALIVLLAQIGSFVPAEEAEIGIVDRIFTRVGASDYLVRGLSTFMVEMNETAHILNNATSKSLIILDEIGRGTSTYDGLSIAWAVVEYIHNSENLKAKTLFATHYHELAEIVKLLPSVKNMSMAIREWNDEIIFLYRVIEGSVDRSYGVEVARLAGLPDEVIIRAREVLTDLENKDQKLIAGNVHKKTRTRKKVSENQFRQLTLFSDMKDPVIKRLSELDTDNLTPIEALKVICELQKKVNEGR